MKLLKPDEVQKKKNIDKALIKDLDEKLKDAQESRMPLERKWLFCLSYYQGEQFVSWDNVRKALQKKKVPSWREEVVVNRIRSVVRTELAKLTKQKPVIGVQPQGNTPDKENEAKMCDRILDYLWDRLETQQYTRSSLLWALICGTGFIKAYWDSSAGEVIDEEGTHIGEIGLDSVSPFEFYAEPLAQNIDDMRWCFHCKVRSPEYVKEKYGEDVKAEQISGDEYLQGKLFSIEGRSDSMTSGVIVKEFWERSSQKYPKGRYVVYAGDKVLFAGDNPYDQAPLPFVAIRHIEVPGRFWGDSIVMDLISPQTNYNKARSQMVEIRNLMVKPKWLVPKGSTNKPITSATAEIIEYTPIGGAKPEPVSPPNVPASYFKELDQIEQEIYTLSGQHEVSNGQAPAGVKSGIAISYLQEQDDTRLGPTAHNLERAIEQLEQMKLNLARQFYIETRIGSITDDDNSTQVFEFSNEDIPSGIDVKVQAGSALPKSLVAKQEFIITLWEQKIIQDPRIVLKMLEFGDVEGIYDDVNLDIQQADRENEQMKQGQMVQPEDFHNHAVHRYEHDKFRKTQEFEELPPEIKQVFADHDAIHKQLEQQVMQQIMPGQEQAQGQTIGAQAGLQDMMAGALPQDMIGQ